jgi:Tuberculosis necrotizing toxin
VHSKLSDWQGEAGDAFRADLNKARRDIEADGHESKQVAAAVARAEADVRAVKAELGGIEQSAEGDGFTITPDWRIDSGGMKLDSAKSASKQQLQGLLDACKLHAHSADQELATAVRSAVGDIPLNAGAPQSPAGDQPKSLEDMMLGRGTPANQKPPPGDPLDLLSRIPPGATGIPAPPLKPAEIESFKAMARKTMISDGVPPDQIEAKLNDVVANTQQWLAAGAPNYVPPEPPRPPPPGIAEGFGDRWNSTMDGIHDLTGQNGLGAMGDAWGGMAKGLGQKAEDYLLMGPVAPIQDGVQEFKSFLDNPAYYAGERGADAAFTAPSLMFGGEGAAVRAGLPAELVTEGGAPLSVMRGWDPTAGMPWADFDAQYGTAGARHWPPNDGFPSGYDPQPAHLPTGSIIDRFGSEYGRYLAPDGTPFADRALTPESVGGDYNRYMVTGKALPPGWQIVEGPIEPWFGQTPSPGSLQYMITGPDGVKVSVKELVDRGILDDYGPPFGR